jgi:hypothetical protein
LVYVEWLPRATQVWLSTQDCVVVITREYTYGWPLRIKEIKMSSMLRVLPVQPYDTMGSVLIEYDVRVHPWVLTVGGIWVWSDSDG